MIRLRRRAWRAWYRLRWLLVDRRAMARTRVRWVAGLDLVIVPGVLDPQVFLSSEVLAEALRRSVPIGGTVLDLGTGCGIGAVAAAESGAGRVVAVDIEPAAVACARANVARHGVEPRVEVREGDLFEPVGGERFDLVAFNPPFLGAADDGLPVGLERALVAPPGLARRFASGLSDHLVPNGRAVVILSTSADQEAWLAPLRHAGFGIEPLLSHDRGSEVITAWRIGGDENGRGLGRAPEVGLVSLASEVHVFI